MNYVQLTFTGKGLLHIYVFKHTLEIRTTENGKGLGHSICKRKAHVNDCQIIHDCLVVNASGLNRHNVIHNRSIKIAAFCHMTVCSLVQLHINYVTSAHFYQSTWLVFPHNGDLHMYRHENLKTCKSATVLSSFVYARH